MATMTSLPPADTVARFVLRARRIGAHSLLQDPEVFARLLNTRPVARIAVDGISTVRFPLPADEEVFESLAARVRPLNLEKESIFYPKVLSALHQLLEVSPMATDQQRDQLSDLRSAWKALKLGRQMQTYAVQSSNLDDTDPTGPVTDTELAAGWMYADLVHADATDWKERTLAFSIQERYRAAVNVFSRIAALALDTLRLIEHLRQSGALTIDEQVWTADVVLGASEIVYEATIYIAAPETECPPLSTPLDQPDGPWAKLTHPQQISHAPATKCQLDVKDADGSSLGTYVATVLSEAAEENILSWSMLVVDGVVLDIEVRTGPDGTAQSSMNATTTSTDLRVLHAANIFVRQLCEAETLVFGAPHVGSFEVPLSTPTPNELLRQQQRTELLEDLVALEDLTGQAIGPTTQVSALERVRIRQARLLWSGAVVQWDRTLEHSVISADGLTPHWAPIQPMTYAVGGVQIAIPEIRVGHRAAIWHYEGPVSTVGPDARRFTVALPDGVTRFLAWSPQARTAGPDELPAEGEPWRIPGIDESEWPM